MSPQYTVTKRPSVANSILWKWIDHEKSILCNVTNPIVSTEMTRLWNLIMQTIFSTGSNYNQIVNEITQLTNSCLLFLETAFQIECD